MPKFSTPIGPFSGVYVGLTSQATALTQLSDVRTGGGTIDESLPTEYIVALDAPIQSGNHTVRLTLSFLGNSNEVIRLVRGLPPGSNINAPIAQTQYAVLVLGADPLGEDNYYLPKVRTEKTSNRAYSKTATTSTAVVFVAENRDVTQNIIYKGNLATIQAAMAGQYPL